MSDRILTITIPSLDAEVLPTQLSGSMALSEPFSFKVTVLSSQLAIQSEQLLQQSATIRVRGMNVDEDLYFNGVIVGVQLGDIDYAHQRTYRLQVGPAFACLRETSDCRIYQHQTVPDIFQAVLAAYPLLKYDISPLTQQYQPRRYCVQYNESDFDFLSRILAEDGIYYTFEHGADSHILMLHDTGYADKSTAKQVLCTAQADMSSAHFDRWQRIYAVCPIAMTSREFDFKQPDQLSTVTRQHRGQPSIIGQSVFENYHYPSDIRVDTIHQQIHRTQCQLQAQVVNQVLVQARGYYSDLMPNQMIDVVQHDDACELGQYMIQVVKIKAQDNSSVAIDQDHQSRDQLLQTCIVAHPADTPYCPKLKKAKPHIASMQSARVVGPKNEAIYTDRYGRVKVQFPWDRRGEFDENSSCFIRVAQSFAGNRYGALFLPRVGQEVWVDFEAGDQDRPIVVGAVNNADCLPPFNPECYPARQGWHTQTLGDHDRRHGHLFCFDDDARKPSMTLKSQRDLHIHVKGDQVKTIGGDAVTVVRQGHYGDETGGALTVQAQESIGLASGSSAITVDRNGVSIAAKAIQIEPSLRLILDRRLAPSVLAQQVRQHLHIQPNVRQKILRDYEGIVTIQVSPRWRRTTPGGKMEAFATLLRLPEKLRQSILMQIMQADQSVTSGAVLVDDWQRYCQSDTSGFVDRADAALQLDHPPQLRDGWIYVFAECVQAPHQQYSQLRLYREYQVTYGEDMNHYAAVDLSKYAGLDARPANIPVMGEGIPLPYRYEQAGQVLGQFRVKVMFSGVQLSWPRINRLGGMAVTDPQLKKIRSAKQKKLLKAVQDYPFDQALSVQRCGQYLPQKLMDEAYQAQYHQQQPIPLSLSNTAAETVWQSKSLYFDPDAKASEVPILLLSDPLGMVLLGRQTIFSAWQQLVGIVNKITQSQGKMPVAVLANEIFLKLRSQGLKDILEIGEMGYIPQTHYQMLSDAAQYLDATQLYKALHLDQRRLIKALIYRLQKTLVTFLTSQVGADDHWGVDVNAAIADYFAQGERLKTAYATFLGMIEYACLDPGQVDQQIDPDSMPSDATVSTNNGQIVVLTQYQRLGYTIYQTETTRYYSLGMPSTPEVVRKVYKRLPMPAGLAYLSHLFNSDSPLHALLFPGSLTRPATSQSLIDIKSYVAGLGHYSSSALQAAFALQYHNPISREDVEYLLINELNIFNTALSGWIDHLKALRHEVQQTAKQMVLKIFTDANGLNPNDMVIASGPISGYQPLKAVIAHDLQQQQADALQQLSSQYPSGTASFMVIDPETGKPRLYHQFDEAQAEIRSTTMSESAMTDDQPMYYVKTDRMNIQLGIKSARWTFSVGSSVVTLLALWDIADTLTQAVQKPDIKNLALFAGQLVNVVNQMKETTTAFVGQEQLTQWVGRNGITQALLSDRFLYQSTSVFGMLGLIGAITTTCYSVLEWLHLLRDEDPAVSASIGLQTVSSSLFLLSSIKGAASNIAHAGMEQVSSGEAAADYSVAELKENIVKAVATDSGEAIEKAGLISVCEFIGDWIPGVDVLMFLAQVAQAASFMSAFFRDTPYEDWVKRSPFAKHPAKDAYTSPQEAYAALLNLVISPTIALAKVANNQVKAMAYSLVLPSLQSSQINLQMALLSKAYPAYQLSGESHDIILLPGHHKIGKTMAVQNLSDVRQSENHRQDAFYSVSDTTLGAAEYDAELVTHHYQQVAARVQLTTTCDGVTITIPNAVGHAHLPSHQYAFLTDPHWLVAPQIQTIPHNTTT